MKFSSFLFLAVSIFASASGAAEIKNIDAKVYFSPKGGAQEAIIKNIERSKKEVLVQAYLFADKPITEALIKAHKRGVDVKVLVDKIMEERPSNTVPLLLKDSVPTRIDDKHRTAHNKVMVIDKETVITGSYNFIKKAEFYNAENLLVLKSKPLAEAYRANWEEHWNHSIAADSSNVKPKK